jgi:hypothetical protein
MKLGIFFSTLGPIFGPKKQSENHCKYFNSVLQTLTKFVLFSNQKVTGNQYSILGGLICLPDCDITSEKRKRKSSIWNKFFVMVCVFVCHVFSYHPFYFDYKSSNPIYLCVVFRLVLIIKP